MMLMQERSFFMGALVEIELHDDLRYLLRFADEVEYRDGKRRIREKTYPYSFRSVEQLRYDFERDVAALGGRLA